MKFIVPSLYNTVQTCVHLLDNLLFPGHFSTKSSHAWHRTAQVYHDSFRDTCIRCILNTHLNWALQTLSCSQHNAAFVQRILQILGFPSICCFYVQCCHSSNSLSDHFQAKKWMVSCECEPAFGKDRFIQQLIWTTQKKHLKRNKIKKKPVYIEIGKGRWTNAIMTLNLQKIVNSLYGILLEKYHYIRKAHIPLFLLQLYAFCIIYRFMHTHTILCLCNTHNFMLMHTRTILCFFANTEQVAYSSTPFSGI